MTDRGSGSESIVDRDVIVVGAGFGGLAAALLLADRGADVLLLEAHTTVGGCAGAFDRFRRRTDDPRSFDRFRFDAGATTLSGLADGHPLRLLFDRFDDPPPIRKVDPGMIVHTPDGRRLPRHADRSRWIETLSAFFDDPRIIPFWRTLGSVADRGWDLAMSNRTFPPRTLSDLIRLARPSNLTALPLLRHLRRSIEDFLVRFDLKNHHPFRTFLDEQLMITAQNRSDEVPTMVGAMGLSYPEDTWYPDGGMVAVAEWMRDRFLERGGEVRMKREVAEIRPEGSRWVLATNRETCRASRVVANLTLPDLEHLVAAKDRSLRRTVEELPPLWGAQVLHLAVPDRFDDGGSLYHQIHVGDIPHISSDSIFVSFSASDDRVRAPEGYRTVTVSSHVADPGSWVRLKRERPVEYGRRREAMAEGIREVLADRFPGTLPSIIDLPATPASFAFFTRRSDGAVGGVPFSTSRNLFAMPTFRTPFEGIFVTGDTVYPGQGVPAVVLGSMNLVDAMKG